jgi:hypothetical protein
LQHNCSVSRVLEMPSEMAVIYLLFLVLQLVTGALTAHSVICVLLSLVAGMVVVLIACTSQVLINHTDVCRVALAMLLIIARLFRCHLQLDYSASWVWVMPFSIKDLLVEEVSLTGNMASMVSLRL